MKPIKKRKKYTVTIAVDGVIQIDVKASDFDEAEKIALAQLESENTGDIQCTGGEVQHMIDEDGNSVNY